MDRFRNPQPDETQIVGAWLLVDGQMVCDETCERIQYLIENRLEELGKDLSGWQTLFRDPNDGRFWKRNYLHGEMLGGGPPSLIRLSLDDMESELPNLKI